METPIPPQAFKPNFPNQLPPQGPGTMMMGMRPGMTPMISQYNVITDQ
jgi:hypothetical protein